MSDFLDAVQAYRDCALCTVHESPKVSLREPLPEDIGQVPQRRPR